MESTWDIVWLVIATVFVIIALVRLVLHFVRPVTWEDGEGPAVAEDGGTDVVPIPHWSVNFWDTLLSYLLFWRR